MTVETMTRAKQWMLDQRDDSRWIVVADTPVVIGRSAACQLQIEDIMVSRRHCELFREGDRLFLRDLGSANGIRVNGRPSRLTELKIGDVVNIGSRARLSVAKEGVQFHENRSDPAEGSLLADNWAPGAMVFEQCRLIERVGIGGNGEVWKAEKKGVGLIAVKRILCLDPIRKEQRALRMMRGLRHRYLARVYGCRRRSGVLVVAMELGDCNMEARFQECRADGQRGIPEPELIGYIRQIAEALDYMYDSRRLLHRDVKPLNILRIRGVAKLCDFGLTKTIEEAQCSHSGVATFEFAPPEYFESKMQETSDQYSLAATYCYLHSGRRPITGNDIRQLALNHLRGSPELTAIPAAQQPILLRALARDPKSRFPSCTTFVQSLQRAAKLHPTANVR